VTNALTNLSKAQNAMYVGGETEKAAAVAPLQAAYDRAYTDWQMSVQKFRETADSTNVQTGVRIGGAGVPQAAGAQVGGVPMGYQIGADGVPVAGVAGAAPGQPNYYNAPPMAPRPGVPYAVQNMAAHGYVTPRPLGPGRMSFAPQGTVQRNTASLAEGARLNAESGATTAGGNQGWLIAGAPGVYGPVLPPDVYGRGR
jgi:hypothetical protein